MLLPRELDLIAAGKQIAAAGDEAERFSRIRPARQEAKTGEEGTDAARAKVEEDAQDF